MPRSVNNVRTNSPQVPVGGRGIQLDLGTGEAEAFWLGRDLETVTVPLHDVVIADDALVDEAADAAEIFWGPCAEPFPFLGERAAQAAVLVWQEAEQDIVGPQTLDAASPWEAGDGNGYDEVYLAAGLVNPCASNQ